MHFPPVSFSPPGCNTHVGGCSGSMKLILQIKINLIILNSPFTRTFNSYNIKRAVHGRIHHKFTHSVVENTVDKLSNRVQGPVPWIKRLRIVHMTSLVVCKKRETDQRNTIIMELEGFGGRKRTIYYVKRTRVSTECLVECFVGNFLSWQTKSVFSPP